MTPGAFRENPIFGHFGDFHCWKWVKLAPIYSKRHLQQDIIPFFPLAPGFKDIFARAYGEIKEIKISSFGLESYLRLYAFRLEL